MTSTPTPEGRGVIGEISRRTELSVSTVVGLIILGALGLAIGVVSGIMLWAYRRNTH